MAEAAAAAVPTPQRIDELSEEYGLLFRRAAKARAALEKAMAPLNKLHEELLEMVGAHGSRHAEKSKILHGAAFEMVATYGEITSLDQAAVGNFHVAMMKANKGIVFRKLFEVQISFSKTIEASEVIRCVGLPDKLLALYSLCETSKPRKPSLKVREK